MSTMNDKKLTHVDSDGHAVMVDVSDRAITIRQATAHGTVHFSPEVTQLLHNKNIPKGDVLAPARIAGNMAAKRTPDLIPLCHPIAIHGVEVSLEIINNTIEITSTRFDS